MANTFNSNTQRQMFEDGVQDELRAEVPFRVVADVNESDAEYVHYRYGADITAENSSDGTYSTTDFTYTDDTVAADQEAVAAELIKRTELSNSGDGKGGFQLVDDRVDRHARALAVAVHRNAYSKTVDGAGLVLDNEVLAGNTSAGTPITVSASNPDEIGTMAYELMQNAGVAQSDGRPYIFLDPTTARFFKLFNQGAGFNTADRQLGAGWQVIPSFDFDYIVTPEVEHEQVCSIATQPTADDTVTVKGVTFTFVASPSSAGDVDLGADVDGSRANLAAAINGGSGAGSTYIALSAADRATLKNAGVVAVNSDSADTLTVTAYGSIAGAETFTDGTDAWGTEKKNLLCGIRKSTLLRLPAGGFTMVENDALEGDTGVQLRTSQMHGAGVWNKNADKIAKIYVAA